MLTRSGISTVVGGIVALIAGRVLGVVELSVLGTITLVLPLLALGWVRRPLPPLAVRRHNPAERITVGGAARVGIEVRNRGTRVSPSLLAIDPVEGTVGARLPVGVIAPGAHTEVGYRLPTTRRGLLEVGPLTVLVQDPFGLARRSHRGDGPHTFTVLPAIDLVRSQPVGGGNHEPMAGPTLRAVRAAGLDELAALRPYVVGDDLRRVHWASSAHRDDLVVRHDEERWQGRSTVVLDARRGALSPELFERAVSAAAGLVHATSEAGDRVRLVFTHGADSGMVDARRSIGLLLEMLALVRQHDDNTPEVSIEDHRRVGGAVVLTGAGDPGPLRHHLAHSGFHPVDVVAFAGWQPDPNAASPLLLVGPHDQFAMVWERHQAMAARVAR